MGSEREEGGSLVLPGNQNADGWGWAGMMGLRLGVARDIRLDSKAGQRSGLLLEAIEDI